MRLKSIVVTILWCCLLSIHAHAQVTDTSVILHDTLQIKPDTALIDQHSAADTASFSDSISIDKPSLHTKQKNYEIAGVVKDKNTGEGVPFATVFIPGTPLGTAADLDGNFLLSITDLPKDTLSIQAVGYTNAFRKLSKNKNQYSFFIELERSENVLEEFVVRPGEDPAIVLLKQIIEHKPQNNPDRTQNYKYEVYNKLEVDLQRLSREQFEKLPVPYMKKFSFIYDNLDTSSEQTPFLPFYLTETISDYYFQRHPKKAKEFIRASQIKGFKNESITKFMGSMYQNINAYDNFIPVFDKQFISPVSNQGLFYYKYKIKDTQQAYGHSTPTMIRSQTILISVLQRIY